MDELKWYLYDIVREVLERHGVEKERYCLERDCDEVSEAGEMPVCLWQSGQEDLYHACHQLFIKLFLNETDAEAAMADFLTETMDLPRRMEKPSRTALEFRMEACRKSMEKLERKAAETGEQKYGKKLALDRIYFKGLEKQLQKMNEK